MKLYHGTTERVAQLALQSGLRPRGDTGVESHWEDCPSSDDHVYLTVAYAPYFAMGATHEEGSGRWAIIEIDTDRLPYGEDWLMPDEDFLEQATRSPEDRQRFQELSESQADWTLPADADMVERTRWFREHLHWFSEHWEQSIKGLGNCTYNGEIPPEAITRICFVEPADLNPICNMALDPTITLLNYRMCESKYRSLTQWLFGDEVEPKDFGIMTPDQLLGGREIPDEITELDPAFQKHLALLKEQHMAYRQMLADRAGIEVITAHRETP